jgi:hypothetical protein
VVTAFDSENVILHDIAVLSQSIIFFNMKTVSAYFEATDKLYVGSLFPNK